MTLEVCPVCKKKNHNNSIKKILKCFEEFQKLKKSED